MSIIQTRIEELTKKTPHMKTWFLETYQKDRIPFAMIEEIYHKLRTYKELIREHKLDVLEKQRSPEGHKVFKYQSFEAVEDDLNEIVIKNEKRKYALSFLSKKYKKLIDDETLDLFYEIKKMNFAHEKVNEVLNKIAAYKTPEQLNDALHKFIETNSQHSLLKIKERANKYKTNIEVEDHDKNLIIVEINNYTASKALGSSSWCISYSKSYFENYLKGDLFRNRQFFLWDFNKKGHEKDHMIGFTVDFKGNVTAAHYQNDVSVQKKKIVELIQEYEIQFSNLSASEVYKTVIEENKNPGARANCVISYINEYDYWLETYSYYKSKGKDPVITKLIRDKAQAAKKDYFSTKVPYPETEKVILNYMKYLSAVLEQVRESKKSEDKELNKKWVSILTDVVETTDFSFISHFIKHKDKFSEQEQLNLKVFFDLQAKNVSVEKLAKSFILVHSHRENSFENDSSHIKEILDSEFGGTIKHICLANYMIKGGIINDELESYIKRYRPEMLTDNPDSEGAQYQKIMFLMKNAIVGAGNSLSSFENVRRIETIYDEIIENKNEYPKERLLEESLKLKKVRNDILKRLVEKHSTINEIEEVPDSIYEIIGKKLEEYDISFKIISNNIIEIAKKLNNQHFNNFVFKNINEVLERLLIDEPNIEMFRKALDFGEQNKYKDKWINKTLITTALKEYNKDSSKIEFLVALFEKVNVEMLKNFSSALKENSKAGKDYSILENLLDNYTDNISLESFLIWKRDILKDKFYNRKKFNQEDIDFIKEEFKTMPKQIKDESKVVELLSEILVATKNQAIYVFEEVLPEEMVVRAVTHNNNDPLVNFLSKTIDNKNKQLRNDVTSFIKTKQDIAQEVLKDRNKQRNKPR